VLQVRGLGKSYGGRNGARWLFRDLSFDLPARGRLAVLGRNGQGKSTLIKILGGVIPATTGAARWSTTSSWPLGFAGGFQGALTGIDNIRFLARIYDRPFAAIVDHVEGFAQLGEALTMPVKYYSSGMRARLAFGLSLAIEFDCYLIDEVIAVGDLLFHRRCEVELFEKRADRGFIIASHDLAFVQRTCERAIVIEGGRAKLFEDLDVALAVYAEICAEAEADRAAGLAA
jgi:capsular polysaccharide transport system ATP-binding protein